MDGHTPGQGLVRRPLNGVTAWQQCPHSGEWYYITCRASTGIAASIALSVNGRV